MHLGYYWPFDLHPSFLLSRKVVSVNFKGIMKIEQASHHDKITACLNGPIFQPGSNTKGILIPQCCKTHKIVQFWEVTLHIICLKKLKYFWNSFWMETSPLFVSKFVSYPLLPTVYGPTCTPLQSFSLPLLLKLVYSSAQKNGENENWTQCASQALMGPTQSCDLILCLSKTFAISPYKMF